MLIRTNAWELRKLGEIAKKIFNGGTPKTKVSEYWNGNIPWIQSSNLLIDNVQHIFIDKKITEKAIENSSAKLVPKNSIAIVTRVGIGKIVFIPYEYATSQDFISLSYLYLESQFTLYSLYRLMKIESRISQGTSIKGITKKDLLSKIIFVPNDIEEQQKIGSFFKHLDELITLHQRIEKISS
ncbi:restriction endonuclease subunit S [Ligilactobacillus animalis]|uniref:restriction endonuclease subunit S n=1 Tax=Ligilactobacillus animalis TaxID=1605 RepID=UPI00384D9834